MLTSKTIVDVIQFQIPLLNGALNQRGAPSDAVVPHEGFDVLLYSCLRDSQLKGNFFVRATTRDVAHDLRLTFGDP